MRVTRTGGGWALLACLTLTLASCGGGSFRVVNTGGGYSFDKTGEKRTKEESGAIATSIGILEISHKFGEVRVFGSDGPPEFSWTLSCWGKTLDDAERFLEEITLERTETGSVHRYVLKIPEKPGSTLRGVESLLTLHVPPTIEVRVKNSFGDAEVRNISGSVLGDCSHCSAELEDLGGKVDWRTSFDDLRARRIAGGTLRNEHGELHVEEVAGDLTAETSFDEATIVEVAGRLEAKNQHGKLTVLRVRGPVQAETSFAGMTVERLAGDAVLRNSHGPIRAREIEGNLEVETSFADLDLATYSERIRASNSHGDVTLALLGDTLLEADVRTSFADLEVKVPMDLDPAVVIDQKHGDVKSPIPHLTAGSPMGAAAGKGLIKLKVRHGDIELEESAKVRRVPAERPIGG